MAARKAIILQQFETRASFFLRGAPADGQTIVAESSNSAGQSPGRQHRVGSLKTLFRFACISEHYVQPFGFV
jgi:hypothetical protein